MVQLRYLSSKAVAAVVLVVWVIGIQILTWPNKLYKGDPFVYRQEAVSLIERGSLAIPVGPNNAFASIPGKYLIKNPKNGELYSKYGVLNSILSLPPLIVEKIMTGQLPDWESSIRLPLLNFYQLLIALALAAVLFVLALEQGCGPWVSVLFVSMCLHATFLWTYLRAQSSEAAQILLFSAFALCGIKCAKGEGSNRHRFWLWVFAGALVLTKPSYVFILPVVVFLTRTGMPALFILVLLLSLNILKFGSPWHSGYHVWTPERHLPSQWPWQGLWGFLVSPQRSVFIHFPILIPALLGWRYFYSKHRRFARSLLGFSGIYFLFITTLPSWAGEWGYGPRYLLFMLPVLSLPAARLLNECLAKKRQVKILLPLILWAGMSASSFYLQWQMTRLDFFAVYEMREPIQNVLSEEGKHHLFRRPFGWIHHEVISHEDDLESLPWLPELKARVSPEDYVKYVDHLRSIVHSGQSN